MARINSYLFSPVTKLAIKVRHIITCTVALFKSRMGSFSFLYSLKLFEHAMNKYFVIKVLGMHADGFHHDK